MKKQEQQEAKIIRDVKSLGRPCSFTLKTPLMLGNPKKDSNWKTPRVSPIVGKTPTTRRRKRDEQHN